MDDLLNQSGVTYAGSIVYFIIAKEVGMIKIGYSTNLKQRFNDLQVACPVELTLLFAVPGSFMNERELHERFNKLRRRGEWFVAKPELLNFIERLRTGEEKLIYSMRESKSRVINLDEDDETFPATMMPASLTNINRDRLNHVNADFPYFVNEEWDKRAIARAYWYLVKRNPFWMVNMPGYEWERLNPDIIQELEDAA